MFLFEVAWPAPVFPWTGRISDPAPRLRRVLASALQTPGYRPMLQSAGLTSTAVLRRLTFPELLERLPYTDVGYFRAAPGEFENPGKPPQPVSLEPLPFDAAQAPVLISSPPLPPEAHLPLAAPLPLAREIASTFYAGASSRLRLAYPLTVLTGLDHGWLEPQDRDLFWEVFQVPIFEQCTDLEGWPFAAECEAHEGLHVLESHALLESTGGAIFVTALNALRRPALRLPLGHAAALELSPCPCGFSGSRLLF